MVYTTAVGLLPVYGRDTRQSPPTLPYAELKTAL